MSERTGGQTTHNDGIFLDVLKSIESGILILDREEETIFFSNPHARKIIGSIGMPLTHGVIATAMAEGLDELDAAGTMRSSQQTLRWRDRIIGYTAYRLRHSPRYLLLFIQDITERKRLDAIAEAVEMSNNIGFIFSGIRHEIGNPLNSLKMALSVLKANSDSFTKEELSVYFERMMGDIRKMESFLKAFKNFNMFEKPVIAPLDLNLFLTNFMAVAGTDLAKAGISSSVSLAPDATIVMADERTLNQVMLNLVANSRDAMTEESEPLIEITSQKAGATVLLSLRDNGCGMSEEQIRRLFKPFHTSKPNGTGLGLVIVKKMLAQMNCNVDIKTKNGEGTTVTIVLPAA